MIDQRKRNRLGILTPITLHEKMNILLTISILILLMTSVIFGVFIKIATLDSQSKPAVKPIEQFGKSHQQIYSTLKHDSFPG